MQDKKIAFIGAGNMAFAVILGLLKSGFSAEKIVAVNKSNQARREELAALGVQTLAAKSAVQWADVVVLAVKPQVMAEVCAGFADVDFSKKWLISVAAGISVARLQQLLPSANNIIRTMPNTPALIGQGMTGLFAKNGTNSAACQFAEQLFCAVGQICWMEQETQINQIIALTGSSPAYFFRFMEAMQKSALAMGFSADEAKRLIQSVALGAAEMVGQNADIPLATLRENVTSKGGTTAKALEVFEQYQIDEMLDNAMRAVVARAEEMERSL